jgi:DNA-binding MarR family transcriptional regulator
MVNGQHGALAWFRKISEVRSRGNTGSLGVSTQAARSIRDGVESRAPANPLFLRDEELRQGIELMFYAYRDFTFESDQQLRRYQLGRAHHRALYFIGRHPGQTVGHLLSILKVTKQSISRVLKDLIGQGYVEQKSGARDRRERLLWLTEKGQELERDLTDRQSQRFARAYRETGAEAVEGFRKVLLGLLDPAERLVVDKRIRGSGR